jgi:hypothetical protein
MRILSSLGVLLAIGLLGCTSNATYNNPYPVSNISWAGAPTTGTTSFYSQSDSAGHYVEAFIGTDTNGFILVSADDAQPAGAYIAINGPSAVRTPAPPATEPFQGADPSAAALPMGTLTQASAAGTYHAVAGGVALALTISPTGTITGTGTSATATGTLQGTSSIAGALPFTLTVTGVTGLTGSYSGYAINSPAYAPATLRLVGQNGTNVLDWLLY